MRDRIQGKWPLLAGFVVLLAGCASVPAPVVDHSFGPGGPAATSGSTQPAQAAAGTQTFGIGHANGTTSGGNYTVARGDTLYSIAFAHGLDFRDLAARNRIAPPYVIHPGQVLRLQPSPTAGTTHAAAGTPPPATLPPPAGAPVFGPVTTQTMTGSGVAAASSTASGAPPAPTGATTTAPAPAAQVPPAPPVSPVRSGPTRTVAGIVWQWPAEGTVISGFEASGEGGGGLNIAGTMGDPVRAAAAGTVVYSGNGLVGYGELVIIKHSDSYLSAYGHNSKRLVKEGQHVEAGQEIARMGASGSPRVELHFEIRKNGKPVDPLGYLPDR